MINPTVRPYDNGPEAWEAFLTYRAEKHGNLADQLPPEALDTLRRVFISGYSAGLKKCVEYITASGGSRDVFTDLLEIDADLCVEAVSGGKYSQ